MKTTKAPTFDEIRAILKEVSIGHKKFQADMREVQATQKETARQMEKNMKETDKKMEETARQMKETDRKVKETAQQIKQTDKQIKAMLGDFGNRWGKLGENLIKGNLAQRLSERGIKVEKVITNAKNKHSEFDIIAINGKEIVVVEVKATLDPSDVEEFQKDMKHFKEWWPDFSRGKRIYGAMAFLMRANREADDLAQKKGFFVIEAVGDVLIQNKKGFKPQVFS